MNAQCIYCQSQSRNELFSARCQSGDLYHYYECTVCHSVFIWPRPSQEVLARAYSLSYYGKGKRKFAFPFAERTVEFFRQRRAARLSSRIGKEGRVLDIGCGNGNFLKSLSQKGCYELIGMERDQAAADRAGYPGIEILNGMPDRSYFEEGSLRAVTLFHVLEHLDEPSATLDCIAGWLTPGGILMITMPNIGSVQARMFRGLWLHTDPPRHLFFMRHRHLKEELERRGLTEVAFSTLSWEQNPFGMIQSILNRFCRHRDLLFERLKGNRNYVSSYPKMIVTLQMLFFVSAFPLFMIADVAVSVAGAGATMSVVFQKKVL